MSTVVEKYPDTDALVAAAGDRLVGAITDAISRRGRALIVLTGGGTGTGLLKRVREQADGIDWSKVHLFWGDDRFVPADDDERNEKQAREALIDHVDIPAANVHAMAPSGAAFGDDLDAAASAYERVLAENADEGQSEPDFDVHLLGMGGEGHINSLFPDTPAVKETSRLVVGVTDSPKPPPRRITLTLPAVQRSREVWLVVSGEAKADAVAAAIGGASPVDVPSAGAVGREATVWLLDEAAASTLSVVRHRVGGTTSRPTKASPYPLPSHDIQNNIGVGLVGNVGRHLDGAVAAGVLIDPGATDNRLRNGIAADEQRGGVGHPLGDDLATGEVERDVACLLSGLVVTVKRGTTAAGRSQPSASGAVENIAGEDELVARAGSGAGEVHLMLDRVVLEKHERRIGRRYRVSRNN
jgi:6-phosphogluconolactonase